MRRRVIFSIAAENEIGSFFEDYNNNFAKRVLIYRRIREFLSDFDFSKAYIMNSKKYIDIADICKIEYITRKNATEVLVINIYLNETLNF